jgi:hypothetical protein
MGDDAAVSAISLVVRDVPHGWLSAYRLAWCRGGGFTQIIYRGMDTDQERNAARAADPAAEPAQTG